VPIERSDIRRTSDDMSALDRRRIFSVFDSNFSLLSQWVCVGAKNFFVTFRRLLFHYGRRSMSPVSSDITNTVGLWIRDYDRFTRTRCYCSSYCCCCCCCCCTWRHAFWSAELYSVCPSLSLSVYMPACPCRWLWLLSVIQIGVFVQCNRASVLLR